MNLDQYVGKVLSGEELVKLLDGMLLVKFMNNDDVHHGMTYQTGLNTDILEFNPNGKCSEGGLYFTTLSDMYNHITSYGDYMRYVTLPDDAEIYVEKNKMKSKQIILSEKVLIKDFISNMIRQHHVTKDDFLERVKQNGHFLKYIDQQLRTNEIMLEAIKKNGYALQYIDQQFRTNEIMLEAIKQNGNALDYIDEEFRTHEIMLEAVKQNGNALYHIDQQFRTNEIMLEAVKQNGIALYHIDQQFRTDEIMLEAVKQNYDALYHIDEEFRTHELIFNK